MNNINKIIHFNKLSSYQLKQKESLNVGLKIQIKSKPPYQSDFPFFPYSINSNNLIFIFYPLSHFSCIIFSIMWYMYLLTNQQTQIQQNQNPITNYSLPSQILTTSSFSQKPFYSQNTSFNIPSITILNDDIKSAFKPFTLTENNSETLPFTENAESNDKQCPQFLPNQKSIKKEKKTISKKTKQIIEQKDEISKNAGRNSTSNIFRVFIKLCSKSKFQSILKLKFQQIATYHSFYISYQYFKLKIKELAPSTSNYINVKQFKKSCDGNTEFSQAFRILFHWFLNNYAINHSLTLKGKHKMMKQSIVCFLNNLHSIEGELWEQKKQCSLFQNGTF